MYPSWHILSPKSALRLLLIITSLLCAFPTVSEAARFWALDFTTCERVLIELLRTGFLARGPDERYGPVTVH